MTANEEHDKLKAQKENADLPTWFDENTSVMPSDFKIGSDFKRSLNSNRIRWLGLCSSAPF